MRKNIFFLVALFLVATTQAFAQPEETPSYGSFTLYGNFPMGDEFSDAARFGGGLGFEGAYFFNPLIGFAYSVDAQLNPYNTDDDVFGVIEDAQPWIYGNLMGGLELSYPITPVIAPEFRVLGGLMLARQPEINTVIGTSDAVVAPAFSYALSGGLKFTNYDSGSAFRVGVRYLAARPTFDGDDNLIQGENERQIRIQNAQLYVAFAFLSRK